MGNQLTGIAPSQILPVEYYLTDQESLEYDASLGSTRFFKVARAHKDEGYVVVKVFVIHDPSLPLMSHKENVEKISLKLANAPNCLTFQNATLTDKAAFLTRQFVKDSLYDRISTRPFLSWIEKKWLAFQLLCVLNQCHKQGICHGDIKSENLMVTSWTWLFLTDFASFKPTYLPEDNPADFSYFFDTSRRRTCYIAPERFVESSRMTSDERSRENNIDLTPSLDDGELLPTMDIFAAGCVLTELFTEGTPPFDLSELLAYRVGEYKPDKALEKIEDDHVKILASHMMQKDPSSRLTAEEYLTEQRDKAFPDYFYTFLQLYLQKFATNATISADDRIGRIKKDLPVILENMGADKKDRAKNSCLVIIISLITANLRTLHSQKSKLSVLELLSQLSSFVTPDVILDRILPYMLLLVNDEHSQVRAESIGSITRCLESVETVPISDANIFPEYILPALSHLTQDPVMLVRVSYAANIARLAETALRFMEYVQLAESTAKLSSDIDESQEDKPVSSYDIELQALHEMVQQKVATLLSDQDNIVKQTLLENGITALCVFFGKQKANDILLSHMITFLNDKNDWHLRGSFFDSLVGVASYVGWQSSVILKPLLQQGLTDVEEFVIHKALRAVIALTELGLLRKAVIHELLKETVPFLCHPGIWVRQGSVGFIAAVARTLNVADVHCNLVPLVQPYLKTQIIQMDKEVIILNALDTPLSRSIFDYILRSQQIHQLFDCLQDRQLQRNLARPGHRPDYHNEHHEDIPQMLKKLNYQGMTEKDEDKLLALKDFMMKIHRSRGGSSEVSAFMQESAESREGQLNLSDLGNSLIRRHADLLSNDSKLDTTPTKRQVRKSPVQTDNFMNEDWKQMFGSVTPENTLAKSKTIGVNNPGQRSINSTAPPVLMSSSVLPAGLASAYIPNQLLTDDKQKAGLPKPREPSHARYSACRLELRNLIHRKKEQYTSDLLTKDVLGTSVLDSIRPESGWRPKGLLVAHLHEHKGGVNRVVVNSDHNLFATASDDGTVKVWEGSRMEGKQCVLHRSKLTYNKQGGQIKTLTFCQQSDTIASASDSGAIHVFRVEKGNCQTGILHTRNLDVESEGLLVDIGFIDPGAQEVLTYATVNGHIIGWDLRAQRVAWKLRNDVKHGLITSFDIHKTQSWLALGTSSGKHIGWDLRFQIPVTKLSHPAGARVRRMICHSKEQSQVISAVQGNNEVSIWDLETAARQKTLWASAAPPLSTSQASGHSVYGMCLSFTDTNSFLLTAGSDMRVRYWDLTHPAKSFILAGAATDSPVKQCSVSYNSKLIEGTEVIQESYSKIKVGPLNPNEDIPRRIPDPPAAGHRDIITDINICRSTQTFVITCGRNGVVKVWK